MNYSQIYYNLCSRGQLCVRDTHTEKHHIQPRCMGGGNESGNITHLTPREHYLAHRLLIKIHPGIWKLCHAFGMMSVESPTNQRSFNSRQYDSMMQARASAMRANNPMKCPAYKEKMSNTRRRKFADGTLTPRIPSSQERERARERMRGEGNPMKGKPEKNPTARPHRVVFDDGTEKIYQYGKLGYEEIGMSRSSWIVAVRTGQPVPSYKVKKITKE